mmetsp:Transcript_54956/g.174732  ORF Transcript_54956/g.174732 Transcript_54956/m.174732 type:complete len:148 (+) Transcript_54956:201-644(+)
MEKPLLRPHPSSRGGALPIVAEHQAFQQLYVLFEVLGRGGFGVVRRAVHVATGKEVAVKIMVVPPGPKGLKMHRVIQQEIYILKTISHSSVMKMTDVYRMDSTYYLVRPAGTLSRTRPGVWRGGALMAWAFAGDGVLPGGRAHLQDD